VLQDLEKVLEPIFFHYKEKRRADEPFGDFCARIGFDQLRSYSAAYVPPESVSSLPQVGGVTLGGLLQHAHSGGFQRESAPRCSGVPHQRCLLMGDAAETLSRSWRATSFGGIARDAAASALLLAGPAPGAAHVLVQS
jgi:hypothetical protein